MRVLESWIVILMLCVCNFYFSLGLGEVDFGSCSGKFDACVFGMVFL